MVRLSMNETTTYRWPFDKDVREYAKAGFQGIGVWRTKLADYGEEHGVRLLVESGLAVSNLFWAGGFTGLEGKKVGEILDDAMQAIRLACCMDAQCLVVYTGPQGGHITKHAWRLAKNALDELVQMADALQVTLAIEPMHHRCAPQWTYLTELEDALRLIDEVGNDRLKLVYDIYHFGDVDLAFLERLAGRIAVVHVGDSKRSPTNEQNRCLIGDGNLPIRELVSALKLGGYAGFFDVELCGEDVQHHRYEYLLEHSHKALADLAAV